MNFPSFRPTFPEKGKIRLFLDTTPFILSSEYSYNWIDCILQYKDRTFSEWLALIQEFRRPVFSKSTFTVPGLDPPVYIFPNVPDMLFHRDIIAEIIETLFLKNLRIRWVIRKFIQKLRQRIMDKRVIGETDLVTLSEIPEKWCVSVYDTRSKAKYLFHVGSIQNYMLESLFTTNFAYAAPNIPKNPYTNLPWHLGQIIHCINQIQTIYFTHRHRFCDTWLIRYRQMDYDIDEFEKEFNGPLQYKAAKAFFAEPANLLYGEIYREVLDDLFMEYDYPRNGYVYSLILDRTLKKELLQKWDEMILYSFILANHNYCPPDAEFKCESEIEEGLNKTYFETLHYVNKLRDPVITRGSNNRILSLVE